MRLFANLLLTISLTVGAIGASSAYLAALSLPDAALVGATLNTDIGLAVALSPQGDLTPQVLQDVRENKRPLYRIGFDFSAQQQASFESLGAITIAKSRAAAVLDPRVSEDVGVAPLSFDPVGNLALQPASRRVGERAKPEEAKSYREALAPDGRLVLLEVVTSKTSENATVWAFVEAGDARITESKLSRLRALKTLLPGERGVHYAHVKEFSFARWEGKWLFLASLVGLSAGAFLIRSATRAEIATAEASRAEGETPEMALEAIGATIAGLRRDLTALPDDKARCEAIVEMIGRAQRDHVPVFVDARTLLISRLSLAGFAALMDRFAAMERQINRAWSAAADNHYPEATACLEKANLLVGETRDRLRPRA